MGRRDMGRFWKTACSAALLALALGQRAWPATIVSATLSIAASVGDPASKVYVNGNLVAPAASWAAVNVFSVPPSWLIPGGVNLIAAMFSQGGAGGVGLSYKLLISYDSGPPTELLSVPGGGSSILSAVWPVQDASNNPWFTPPYSTAAPAWSANTVTAYAVNCSAAWPAIAYSGGSVPYLGYAGGCSATGTNIAFRHSFSLGPQPVATPTPLNLCTLNPKTVVGASFSISGDDKVETFINGHPLGLTPSDYSYTQVYSYPIPIGWLNPGSSNVIATTNFDLHGGDMGTTYKLLINYSDGSKQEIISDPTQNSILYYYDGTNTPGPLAYPPVIGGKNWYDTAYSVGAGWSPTTVLSAQKCFAQWADISYSGGLVPWMGSAYCDTVQQYQTWSFRQTFNLCTFAAPSATPTLTPSPSPVPCSLLQRLHAGGAAYTDVSGGLWSADQAYSPGGFGYVSGTSYSTVNSIAATSDPGLYQSMRQFPGLNYKFTLPNGMYRVTLKFAELYFTAPGQRVFNASIQGSPVISNLDLVAAAGPFTAYDMSFPATVAAGILDISFSAVIDQAVINAIQIQGLASLCSPTPTPSPGSPTPTATPTPSPTQSPSPTPTPSSSPSPSSTATPSMTRTATSSATPSATATQSPTGTFTPSFSLTATPSVTPTLSPSVTATPSASHTPTATPSPSDSATATLSQTPTLSPSFSVSPTVTPTPPPLPYGLEVSVYNGAGERVKRVFKGSAQFFTEKPLLSGAFFFSGAGSSVGILMPGYQRSESGALSAGGAAWDLTNDAGQSVAGGIYYIKIEFEDAYGKVSTHVNPVSVARAEGNDRLAIYNPAGEIVWSQAFGPALPPIAEFSLAPGGGSFAPVFDSSGQNLGGKLLILGKDDSGAPQTLSWDGRNNAGQPVASGSYTLQLQRQGATGAPRVLSRQITVIKAAEAGSLAGVLAGPSPLHAGQNLRLVFPPGNGASYSVAVYNLAGELVAERVGIGAGDRISLAVSKFSGGIYLVDVRRLLGGQIRERKTFKWALLN